MHCPDAAVSDWWVPVPVGGGKDLIRHRRFRGHRSFVVWTGFACCYLAILPSTVGSPLCTHAAAAGCTATPAYPPFLLPATHRLLPVHDFVYAPVPFPLTTAHTRIRHAHLPLKDAECSVIYTTSNLLTIFYVGSRRLGFSSAHAYRARMPAGQPLRA